MRIVSLAPSATSILCEIGARKLLAGVTKWCADVAPGNFMGDREAVNGLPKLGDCWRLELKDVLALEPTLVIGSVPFKPETVAKLLEQPFTFLALNPRTLADVESDIRMLARLVDRGAQGERVVSRMKKDFARVSAKAGQVKKRPRVYCEAWPNPRISSPPWVAELVGIAGGEFVVPAGEKLTDEQVAAARPDVIVLAWAATGERADARRAYEVAAWGDLPAIRNRRVYVVRDEVLNTPGPPLVEGARELYRLLHGKSSGRGGA